MGHDSAIVKAASGMTDFSKQARAMIDFTPDGLDDRSLNRTNVG